MDSDRQEQFQREYQAGQEALEHGQYRRSVQHLEAAKQLVAASSRLGGEVQMWLVNAYQAAGRLPEARSLCQKLTKHPHPDTRKQSKQILYIIDAPRLQRSPDWLTKIPTVENWSDGDSRYQQGSGGGRQGKNPLPEPETIDLSQVNTKDNGFIWLALLLILLVLYLISH